MKSSRWQLSLAALILTALAAPWPVQAQAQAPAVPPPVPKALVTQNFKPGPGRYVSTVDNFDGLVAGSNMQGTGKDNNGNTLYWEADMRAMQGDYINSKGLTQRGTFVFTWFDVYNGSGPNRVQLHDIHIISLPPPLAKPGDANYGPFWTSLVPEASLKGNPYTSLMELDLTNLSTSDSFILFGPNEVPSTASMAIAWMPGPQGLFPYSDPAPTYSISNPGGGYAGEYTLAGSHIDFSFTSQASFTDKSPFSFTTDPDGQRVLFAQVGHELNGLFMH